MNQALFENIIKKWRKRSDPTERLTLNQIANMVLLSGSSKNASIIGIT
jgi:predicted NBD/HSP70 family sugar kinase